jgi:prepilin-type N-terminal cleavage/methylation domain-containing protein
MTAPLGRLRRRGDDSGFTLIELLVVVVLMGVIGSIFMSGMVSAMRADRQTRSRVGIQADLTKGVDRMTKQIRVAYPVIAFSPTSLTVEAYRNNLRYRYTYTYTSATKKVTETMATYTSATAVSPTSTTTKTLLTNVTNGAAVPMFAYYDRNGTVATAIADIARVELTLVETPAQLEPIRFQTSVFLRNYRET